MNILYILSLVVINNANNERKSVWLPAFYNYNSHFIFFLGNVGNTTHDEEITIDLAGNHSLYITHLDSSNEEIKNFKISKVSLNYSKNVNGLLTYSNLDIPSSKFSDFYFLTVEKDTVIRDKIANFKALLSLSRSSYSFVNYLFSYRIIENKKITFLSSFVVLGDNTDDLSGIQIEYLHVNTVNYYKCWACNVNYIIVGNLSLLTKNKVNDINLKRFEYIETKGIGVFDTMESGIYAPIEFEVFFYNKVFKKMIDTKKCFRILYGQEVSYNCKESVLEKIPTVNMILDGIVIQLKHKQLFSILIPYASTYSYRIKFKRNLEHFIFGFGVIRQYLMSFDEDSNRIGFDKSRNVYQVSISQTQSRNELIILFVFISFIHIISSVLLLKSLM